MNTARTTPQVALRAALSFRSLLTTALLGTLLTAGGCGSTDRVIFVTGTVLGLDADTRTQSASIGYSRVEGVTGPAYRDGGVPPVYARLESNLSLFSPEIDQLYATGDAARIIADKAGTPTGEKDRLSGSRRVMFFGTATHFGLQLGFGPAGVQSGTLGYKRIEYSRIPIQSGGKGKDEDVYPSVLASISIGGKRKRIVTGKAGEAIPGPTNASVPLLQFFATGDAAEGLAVVLKSEYQMDAVKTITKTSATYGPDDRTAAIQRMTSRQEPSENGKRGPAEASKADACRKAFLDYARDRGLSPTLLLYAREYAEQRKELYDYLEKRHCAPSS